MPPASTCEIGDEFIAILKKLKSLGIDAILSGNPGNSYLCKELGLENMQDLSSNVFNSDTARLFVKDYEANSITPSAELNTEDIIKLTKKIMIKSDSYIELPAYGKLRLMYSEHCPVGFNKPECKICEGHSSDFSIKDKKGMVFPVICHNKTCTVDILNSNILCVPSEVYKIAEISKVRTRLIFTGETLYERKTLVEEFNSLLRGKHSSDALHKKIEDIRSVADGIAKSQNRTITKGHYGRGV